MLESTFQALDRSRVGTDSRASSTLPWRALLGAPALRRFARTMAILVAMVTALFVLAPVEHSLLGGAGIADSPFSSLVLILGMPHFLIGALFMATSRATRGVRHWLPIVAAVLIGIAFDVLLSRYTAIGTSKQLASSLVGLYFFFHVFRDEWFFRSRDRDGATIPGIGRVMCVITLLIASYEFMILSRFVWIGDPAHNLRHYFDPQTIAGWSRTPLWLTIAVPSALIIGICYSRLRPAGSGVVLSTIRRDPSLWCVYGLIFLLFAVSAVVGGKLSTIVLIHLIAWWVFVTGDLARAGDSLARRSAGADHSIWTSIRRTQTGFQTLHGLLVALFLILLLLYTHNVGRLKGTAFDYVLTQDAFFYWTVMHVTISLFPGVIRRSLGWESQGRTA